MIILGIESSCDETGVALYDGEQGLLAHALHSQIDIHAEYGGVVPELASRDHIRKLIPLIEELCQKAQIAYSQINGIAYTQGPGLVGALFVGACFAKALGFAWQVPTLGIHHMEGHLLAPMLEKEKPSFPFLALLVSGGHTQLVHVHKIGHYSILGESLDDAAGEAFDKTAKLLGLDYPGGPLLAKLADTGDPTRYQFPRPLLDRPGLDFSFSGLKTSVLNTIRQTTLTDQTKADIARGFQDAVVDTLVRKCKRALEQTGLEQLVIAGGVGANLELRKQLRHLAEQKNIKVFYPRIEFCTDNGAMIAFAGYQRLKDGQKDENLEVHVRPRWPMSEI